MTPTLSGAPASAGAKLRRLPPLSLVIGFLLLTRLVLNLPASLGANLTPLQQGAVAVTAVDGDPYTFPGIWARWDSGFYLQIANTGYKLGGDMVAFFPGYPLLLKALALGQPALMLWAGYLIANLAFVAAGALLWKFVDAEYGRPAAWATVVTLALFPTALFFSALYAESLYLLMGVLTLWFTVRRRYYLAATCVAGAAVTRITGALFILIPLVELWQQRPPHFGRQPAFLRSVIGLGLISATGPALYGAYLFITQGSPIAFVGAQTQFWVRSVVWPWQTVIDASLVALVGYGGNEANWFMRVISLADLLPTLLMIGLTIVGLFWLRRGLAAYQVAALLFMLVSHGPYSYGLWSMSRVVLGLFPGFIVLGLLLTRSPRMRWVAWAVWAVSVVLLMGLTAWFSAGRWVA